MTTPALKDSFTHFQYGTFQRFRSTETVTFVDAVRHGLKRGKVKSRTITSKNYVLWTPSQDTESLWLSLATWGEIHALFDKNDMELKNNPLHKFLLATTLAKPDHTPT